jgi:serpin B
VFLTEGLSVRLSFKRLISKFYSAGLEELDFAGDPQGTADYINQWVEDRTNGKIKDIVSPDLIQQSVMALANAIYFKGFWKCPFNTLDTRPAPFKVSRNQEVSVNTMIQTARLRYSMNSRVCCQIVELPYEGDRLAMYILLPTDRYGLAELEKKLTFNTVTQALARLWHRRMSVAIPKIKMTVLAKGIPKKLKNMGMKKLFTRSADFTGISHVRPLFVSDVIHKAFVDIDEVGTEAAAATVVLFSRSLPQSIHKDFTIDHPYLFLIRDSITGSILFLGRVVLPES